MAAILPRERALWARRGRQRDAPPGDALAQYAVHGRGRVGERQLREGDQVAVDLERVEIDVVEGVARLVVAGSNCSPATPPQIAACSGVLGTSVQVNRPPDAMPASMNA